MGLSLPSNVKRPGLLRHVTDDGQSRGSSPAPTLNGRNKVDRVVKADVMAGRQGGGRLGAMVKGPDGLYAVGGSMGEQLEYHDGNVQS